MYFLHATIHCVKYRHMWDIIQVLVCTTCNAVRKLYLILSLTAWSPSNMLNTGQGDTQQNSANFQLALSLTAVVILVLLLAAAVIVVIIVVAVKLRQRKSSGEYTVIHSDSCSVWREEDSIWLFWRHLCCHYIALFFLHPQILAYRCGTQHSLFQRTTFRLTRKPNCAAVSNAQHGKW